MEECYQTIELENDIFDQPERILIFGASNSGKSYLLQNLVKKYHKKFYDIVISGEANKLLDYEETKHITTHYKNENNPIYDPFSDLDEIEMRKNGDKQILTIYDDVMEYAVNSMSISNQFSRGRHKRISTIIIFQNYFPNMTSKSFMPMLRNNSSIQIFCKMRSVSEISMIARGIEFDKKSQKFFIDLIKNVVQNNKYAYIALFLDEFNSKLRYRSNLCSEDGTSYSTVYIEP